MDPNNPTWIFAQFVRWAKDNGGPYRIYRIVQGRKVVILLLVIETLALLGIGTYEFIRNREKIVAWCRRKLNKVKVTQEDIDDSRKIVGMLEAGSENI